MEVTETISVEVIKINEVAKIKIYTCFTLFFLHSILHGDTIKQKKMCTVLYTLLCNPQQELSHTYSDSKQQIVFQRYSFMNYNNLHKIIKDDDSTLYFVLFHYIILSFIHVLY